MRCESVCLSLTDLADCSLPPAAAWRVRKHIKNCAACQKAWAEAQTFQNEVRALYAPGESGIFALPTGLRTRTLQAADSTNAAVLRPVPRASRRSFAGGIAAFGAAAGVASAIIGLVWVTPGTPVRPTIAFAQVEAAMQQVKTVHWIETSRTRQGIHGPWRTDYVVEKWARLDPPALLEKRLPGGEPDYENVILSTPGQSLMWKRKNNQEQYTVRSETLFLKATKVSGKNTLRSRIAWDATAPIVTTTNTSQKGSKTLSVWKTPWSSKVVVGNHQNLILFERSFSLPDEFPKGTFPNRPRPRQIYQVWVEPSTHHVVRRKFSDFPDGENLETEITADHFVYNENLPPSTFVLTIPPGAVIKREAVPIMRTARPVWNQLPAGDKEKIQSILDRADRGWRTVDFDKFSSAWDMKYLHVINPKSSTEAVRKKQWRLRLAYQKNYWKEWRSRPVTAYEENTFSGAALPLGAPPLLRVSVIVIGRSFAPNGASKPWTAPATFYLRQLPGGGFKIINWENAEALGTGWATMPQLRSKFKN